MRSLAAYAWPRAELRAYKYPIGVNLYETLSDNLHRFENPSERDYYNGISLTQGGYFYLHPHIIFQPRDARVSSWSAWPPP